MNRNAERQQTIEEAYQAMIGAEKAFHKELVKTYGNFAADARHDSRRTATPELDRLDRALRETSEAYYNLYT